jgi:hypothetical protein
MSNIAISGALAFVIAGGMVGVTQACAGNSCRSDATEAVAIPQEPAVPPAGSECIGSGCAPPERKIQLEASCDKPAMCD